MDIRNITSSQVGATYSPSTDAAASSKAKTSEQRQLTVQHDQLSLSPAAQHLQKALQAAKDAPDVRAEFVAQLRNQVQSGQYQVDAEALADKLLDLKSS